MAASLPPWGMALVVVGGIIVLVAVVDWATRPAAFPLRGKTVVITGGSSGIGKATAQEVLRAGGRVAIIARRHGQLAETAKELAPYTGGVAGMCTTHSADVTDEESMRKAMEAIAASHGGAIDAVVSCAGLSLPRRFEETATEDWVHLYRINVLGNRNAAFTALPHMTRGGRFVIVSSQAGQTGVYGYAAYSSSKFALQGLAQVLQQEVYTRGVLVSQCFPPDTDTPQFADENKLKPALTAKLSESTGLVQPHVVGRAIVSGMVHWRPYIGVGFDGWMLSQLTAGMGVAGSFSAAIVQTLFLGLFRAISLLYVQWFYHTIVTHDKSPAQRTVAETPILGATGLAAAAAIAASAPGAAPPTSSGKAGGALAGMAVPLVSTEHKRK